MAKIVVSENLTLDGVYGDEGLAFDGWFARLGAEDRAAWAEVEYDEAREASALLLGGRSYEWFVAAGWPARDGAWADRLREIPKYAVSSSLGDLAWPNTTVLGGGDAAAEVEKLKEQVDGTIVVYASGRLVRTLLAHHLVDELRLMVFPFVLDEGRRLFAGTGDRPLRLAATRTVGDGLALLTYRPATPEA